MCKNFMVIRHSIKELLAKSMVTRPMKCIVVIKMQGYCFSNDCLLTLLLNLRDVPLCYCSCSTQQQRVKKEAEAPATLYTDCLYNA